MVRHGSTLRDSQSDAGLCGYVLIVRGPDGRPHFERFDDVAAYRARLVELERSNIESFSIEEIVGLLDA